MRLQNMMNNMWEKQDYNPGITDSKTHTPG